MSYCEEKCLVKICNQRIFFIKLVDSPPIRFRRWMKKEDIEPAMSYCNTVEWFQDMINFEHYYGVKFNIPDGLYEVDVGISSYTDYWGNHDCDITHYSVFKFLRKLKKHEKEECNYTGKY